MNTSPRPRRNPALLSLACEQRLNAYASAAAAAGVGVLALAQPASAKVIYTPADVIITTESGYQNYSLDLNHDGVADFGISAYYEVGRSSQFGFLRCAESGKSNNRVWGHGAFDGALRSGVRIGPGGRFDAPDHSMARVSRFAIRSWWFQGPWANGGKGVKDRYLGFLFHITGVTHYGWARLNVKVKARDGVNITATLTGYAYEAVPNKAIIAGKTKGPDVITLGHLARGASAIPAWELRQKARPGS